MPKFASKSRSSQRTISSYFTGVNQRPGAKQKVSTSTDDGSFGAPAKRARLQQEEPETPRIQEASVSLSRGAAGICSSTLERLRGFTCLSEPSINPTYSERDQKTHEGSAENVILPKSQVPPCAIATHQAINKNSDFQPEQEKDGEEEDDEQEENGPGQASFNKYAKSRDRGRRRGGEAKPKEMNPVSDSRRVKSVYTPLEQQVIQLKQQHKDALLAVECGYKYRFFGEDAEIAAKELNIFCHPDHNFMTCSIPTHRLFVHVRRLVSHGHKVAVVKQTETSAIKASGTNRNALFTRQLSALYTKSTLVGEDVNPVCRLDHADQGSSAEMQSEPPENFLLCISENCDKVKKQFTIGLVAVQPSTGDVFLDCFLDGPSRSELENRVLRINPVEILVPSDLSDETQRLLKSISNASAQADDRARVETRDSADFEFASAMNKVTQFYCGSQEAGSRMLSSVASLEASLICCLGPLIQYLQEFNLDRVLRSQSLFQRLSCASEGLKLSAATLKNLEILNNQTDGGLKGSLLWVLDHTCTNFGRRLMRKWVSQPLTDVQRILERQTAVQEILESNSPTLTSVQSLLTHLPDLDRGICSIYHKRSSTQEFYLVSSSLSRLALELEALLPAIQSQVSSPLLRDLLLDTPNLLAPAHSFLKVLSEKAAKSGNKTELFSDLSNFPVLRERKEQIQAVLDDIYEHRKEIRLTLKAPALDYTAVSGQEFLIEVKNSLSSAVPLDWLKISSTKAVSRYHSPFLVEHYKKLLELREQLLLDCQQEWIHFLDEFGQHYHTMKRAISHLATLDCLLSLALVAKQGHYCRPEVCESQRQIVIRDGRHPAIDLLMGEQSQYVPNNTDLQGDGKRTMVITGPNMGGKSSYIRQVALICVMAQIGSYVPATAASVGTLDAVYSRMGASDNIYKGRSTFMEELTEASEIISKASERSLVILDELGRGTSTHDGIAIAYATLQYFIRDAKALTLFVTHYPPLCELEQLYPRHVSNHHMAFLLNEPDADADGEEIRPEFITFLYQLTEGAAGRSYGLNVARLADIPNSILHTAVRKSRELERTVDARRANRRRLADLWRVSDRSTLLEWLQSDC